MSNESWRRSHALHGVERQDSSRSKWYLASLHVHELAFKLGSIIFPCPRKRRHGEDTLEGFPVSHASGAGFRENGTVGTRAHWQKQMLAIMKFDQNSFCKLVQQYFRVRANAHSVSCPVLALFLISAYDLDL